jgi:voltage-gated potassium channel
MPNIQDEPRQLLVGAALMLVTGIFQTFGVVVLQEFMEGVRNRISGKMTRARMVGVLSGAMIYLFVLHLLEMGIWAALYKRLAETPSFASALYESALAFTTMDVAKLPHHWRFLSPAEGITGLLMFAWSTSVLFNQTTWVTQARRMDLRKRRQGVSPKSEIPPAS